MKTVTMMVISAVLAAMPARASDVIGANATYVADARDTFDEIARDFNLGYVELVAANPGVDPWVPGAGREVLLPTAHVLPDAARRGIVINLPEMRLYLFDENGQVVTTHPIGIGREGWETPMGETRIVRKRKHPTWTPPASIRQENPDLPAVVQPGPDNPLGHFALYLDWPAYLLHGTNQPSGVGRRVSHGCIRLYPEDVAYLYATVSVGTPVRVIDQPVKLGWSDGHLYLEVHPSLDQVQDLALGLNPAPREPADLRDQVLTAAGPQAARLDWNAIRTAAAERSGRAVRITSD